MTNEEEQAIRRKFITGGEEWVGTDQERETLTVLLALDAERAKRPNITDDWLAEFRLAAFERGRDASRAEVAALTRERNALRAVMEAATAHLRVIDGLYGDDYLTAERRRPRMVLDAVIAAAKELA
jgi:hypothetical protein